METGLTRNQIIQELAKSPHGNLLEYAPGSRYSGDVDLKDSMARAGLELQEFDMRKGFDYYSLPNIVQTMRTSRYSLVEEIMATRLLRVEDVLK